MKKTRFIRSLAALFIGVLVVALVACAPNEDIVIGGDTTQGRENDIAAEGSVDSSTGGTFEYAINNTGDYTITGYNTKGIDVVDVVIPSKIGANENGEGGIVVTEIGAEAFRGCTYVKSITIPDTVTKIGEYAFAGCTYLTEVKIPDSVTVMGEGVFANCTSLPTVTVPATITVVPNHMFSGCSSLASYEFKGTLTEIGAGAFKDCTALTSVTIPDSVLKLGTAAYYGCSSLTFFKVGAQLTFATVGEGDLEMYDPLNSTIGEYALYRVPTSIVVECPEGSGMAKYYEFYELDEEPAPFVTTVPETTTVNVDA